MKRPYKVDEKRVAHKKTSCHRSGPTNTDANKDGLIEGMCDTGYGLCGRCISSDERVELFENAAEYTKLLL